MTTTDPNTTTPSWQGQPEAATLKERLIRLLPDDIVHGTRQLLGGSSNLEIAKRGLESFGEDCTQADLDAEARRRTQTNQDPQATPSPGAFGQQGKAEAARRFGTMAPGRGATRSNGGKSR